MRLFFTLALACTLAASCSAQSASPDSAMKKAWHHYNTAIGMGVASTVLSVGPLLLTKDMDFTGDRNADVKFDRNVAYGAAGILFLGTIYHYVRGTHYHAEAKRLRRGLSFNVGLGSGQLTYSF